MLPRRRLPRTSQSSTSVSPKIPLDDGVSSAPVCHAMPTSILAGVFVVFYHQLAHRVQVECPRVLVRTSCTDSAQRRTHSSLSSLDPTIPAPFFLILATHSFSVFSHHVGDPALPLLGLSTGNQIFLESCELEVHSLGAPSALHVLSHMASSTMSSIETRIYSAVDRHGAI